MQADDLDRCPICQHHFGVLLHIDQPLADKLRARFQPGAPALWHENPPRLDGSDLVDLELPHVECVTSVCLVCSHRFALDLGLPPRLVHPACVQLPQPGPDEDPWMDSLPVPLAEWDGVYAEDLRAQLRERHEMDRVMGRV